MTNTMTYKGYTVNMVFDAEDKVIVGRVIDIDDIISFHGESVSEFEANFHAAIDDYLAASKELGSAPEKPASGKVMLRRPLALLTADYLDSPEAIAAYIDAVDMASRRIHVGGFE
jgi:predicted HicB family RNase H-like nuclease